MSFSLTDVILFIGISQGLFLMFSLQFITKKNRAANNLLTLLLAFATFIFSGKIATQYISAPWVWRASLLSDITIFIFGPLLYTYFYRLAFQQDSKQVLSFYHYIPAFLHFLFFCWTCTLSTKEFYSIYYTITIQIIFTLMEFGGLFSLLFFTVLSFKLIKKLKVIERKELSYQRNLRSYIKYVLIGLSIFQFFWILGIIKTYILKSYNLYISYDMMWISTPIFLYVIGYYSLRHPEIIRLPYRKTTNKDRLSSKEVLLYNEKLKVLMNQEKVYIQSDLSLKGLAKQLGTSPNNLSWMLNSVHEKTFYEYINAFRVQEFLQKISEGAHEKQTLFAIAMDSGFNSKSTFNKSFKLLMNDTPSNYIQKLATA